MRGDDLQQSAMFSYFSPEQRVPTEPSFAADSPITDGAS